jgi:hypothetical protein
LSIDHIFGALAIVAPYVTDGDAPQIRLPEKTPQVVPAAIPDPYGAQNDSFARGHTAALSEGRARDELRHTQANTGLYRAFEETPPV